MGGLVSALGAAQRSLSTISRGLAVVQENIANAATPGYARQRVDLAPIVIPGSGISSVFLTRPSVPTTTYCTWSIHWGQA